MQEIAAHLTDQKNKEGLAVSVEVSEGGKRVFIRAEDGGGTFYMERGGFPNEGMILIGKGRPPTAETGPQTQVTNGHRVLRERAEAIGEAEMFMRRFKRG
jgi:hypothetical protein